jgi:hypothetical protein
MKFPFRFDFSSWLIKKRKKQEAKYDEKLTSLFTGDSYGSSTPVKPVCQAMFKV